MEVKLSAEQSDLVQSVRGLLERHRSSAQAPGPAQADLGALEALQRGGFTDIISSGGSAVDAVLVVEETAALAPGAPAAGRILVGPLVTGRDLPPVVALAERAAGAITRFAPQAGVFLGLADDVAWLADRAAAQIEPVASRWGYPVARVTVSGGDPLGPGSREALLNAWRIGLAAEAGGLMQAATLHASQYVTVRHQFGKPIGALQSIQHRLARAYVLSQGTKWLARQAAWDAGDPVAAAAAASYGAEGIREVMSTTHQVCGAIGITDEFGLTAYTARLATLQTELGGAIAHARALAHARWDGRVSAASAQGGERAQAG
jgi:Acyl-CoA dehydrogenase, C-terminal domain